MFPKDFLWGAAISSYQTEGNNFNSDWWEWEQKGKTKDKSGIACDYWNKYKEDHYLLQELGVNSFRLSLEWSRIEPEEGKFSEEAISHYREILQDLKDKNIKIQVTFWHWTSPIWFQEGYGLHHSDARRIIFSHWKKIVDKLGDLIDIAVIINEPMMPLVFGYLNGKFPPGIKYNLVKYKRAFRNLSDAYLDIYKYIKEKNANLPVGITQLYNFVEPKNKINIFSLISVFVYKKFWNESFLNKIKNNIDYIGLDYYFHDKISFFWKSNENLKTNDLGWEIYPEGIYEVLMELKNKYNLPVYVMENGLADADDKYRSEFIRDHLGYILKAKDEGVDVRGYNYWSLTHNFEWLHGFDPRFGPVEIDYKTLERKPRKSYFEYQKIIGENVVLNSPNSPNSPNYLISNKIQ
jgi:beta-glucosidase